MGTFAEGQLSATVFIAPDTEGDSQTTVRYGVGKRFELGAAYVTGTNSVVALANYLLITERGRRPALSAGIGIDRVGGSDPAGFLVASKNFPSKRHPASAHFGFGIREAMTTGGGDPTEIVEVGGLTGQVARNLNASMMWDGSDWHAGLQTRWKGFGIAALAVRMEHPGVIVGYSWQLKKPGGRKRRSADAEEQ